MNSVTAEEIQEVRRITGMQVIHDSEFPQVLRIESCRLGQGWSALSTNLMLVKERNEWTAFLDGNLSHSNPVISAYLNMYADQGWTEVIANQIRNADLYTLLRFLNEAMALTFTNSQPQPNEENRGFIQNSFCFMKTNEISVFYEYLGDQTIVTLEIYSHSGVKVRKLDIEEISSGWVMNTWDGKDDDGKDVNDGFYYLKIRAAQPSGELTKVILIHKMQAEK